VNAQQRDIPDAANSTALFGVAIHSRRPDCDVKGRAALADARRRGLRHIHTVASTRFFFFKGAIDRDDIQRLADELLLDPVIETRDITEGMTFPRSDKPTVDVHYKPGVMDPVANSSRKAANRLLAAGRRDRPDVVSPEVVSDVRTAYRYEFDGVRDLDELRLVAEKILANDCIETTFLHGFGRSDPLPNDFPVAPVAPFEKRTIPLAGLDENQLAQLSRDAHLFLSIDEMRAIQRHYESRDRDPSDIELETLAQTWSEHCVHKTLKSEVVYRGDDFGKPGAVEIRFENLLKDTIVEATRRVNKPWCLSVFVDNAGVIAFDDDYAVAFKVETHNHPSAIEPYGGAATGIGGCIRDILGCGLGAKPIASTDVFCLADPNWPADALPEGVLHPRRVLVGVVSGVRDYGNRMGIPTVNGALYFDPRYLANPLVFCGCVGLIPRDKIQKRANPGDRIVVVGGRTGRDGIHGATFSSSELTDTHADEFSHAVQIGNAIEEKKVLEALLAARDHASGCLYSSVTDCGAGGLSSAVGEMGEHCGAVVDLDRVPLKYAGLRYDEIWISEAQERMVFAVPESNVRTLIDIAEREGTEATVIGRFTDDGLLRLRYDGTQVGELEMEFLHDGLPKTAREAQWSTPKAPRIGAEAQWNGSLEECLLMALGSLNIASKEWVIRQYDHEVQAGSSVKPLVGVGCGPADAAVIRPRLDSDAGLALSNGLCPHVSDSDPYEMAISAVDEALRNVICVGGDPDRTAILDNFCWGGVDTPESMGALVRCCKGAHDAAVAFGLPFISGKDSLNNQFSQDPEEAKRLGLPAKLAVPHTLLVSAISHVADVTRCVTSDFKQVGNAIVVVGSPGETSLEQAFATHRRVSEWIRSGRVASAHDVSDGGLAVAVAEMCIGGAKGAEIDLDGFDASLDDKAILFGEYRAFYVLECQDSGIEGEGVVFLGRVTDDGAMSVLRGAGNRLFSIAAGSLSEAWKAPLASAGGL
jgi:phosphoribosylformylglycinamidine synthase